MDIGISGHHCGYVQDDTYIEANKYVHYGDSIIGDHLVLNQHINSAENEEWHLSQDFCLALGLKREGDIWVRPNEGFIEIAKLHRRDNESPYLLEVRSSHLRDYLCEPGKGARLEYLC